MARRTLDRRELRRQSDLAEQKTRVKSSSESAKEATGPTQAGTVTKVKRTRRKKGPPRLCARWAIYDGGMKQVAIFDYNQRAEADCKIAALSAKKAGAYFLQLVKEPMIEASE